MPISGKEWSELSPQQISDSIQNYSNSFSQDPSYLSFIIFGADPVKNILAVPNAKGLKIKMGLLENEETGAQQLYPILVAVDASGNELPYPEVVVEEEENNIVARGGGDSTPIKCPPRCSGT